MKRTSALTLALALASLGVSAYAQTTPADQGQPSHSQTTKKPKKEKKEKKDKKAKASHGAETR